MKEPYDIKCHFSIFNKSEIEYLKKYGHFMEVLLYVKRTSSTDISDAQRNFIEVMNGGLPPMEYHEVLWFKYRARCEWEVKKIATNWEDFYKSKYWGAFSKYCGVEPKDYSKIESFKPPPRKDHWSKPSTASRTPRPSRVKFPKKPRPKKTGKGDIPEHQRRRVDEGFGGSRRR